MDGLTLATLVRGWKEEWVGCRVDKIQQPTASEILLSLRHRQGSRWLLLSAHKAYARVHFLTGQKPVAPPEPPRFCMQLRRHIEGGRLLDVRQLELDRVVQFFFSARSELGDLNYFVLTLEIMGKHSNLILTTAHPDGQPDEIIDAIYFVDSSKSRVRQIFPGIPYEFPPTQKKIHPLEMTAKDLPFLDKQDWLGKANQLSLIKQIAGLGPTSARESLYRCSDVAEEAQLALEIRRLATFSLRHPEPHIGLDEEEKATAYAPFPLHSYPKSIAVSNMSEAVAQVFHRLVAIHQETGEYKALSDAIRKAQDRLRGKLAKISALQEDSHEHDRLRMFGELLLAYGYSLPRGAKEAVLPSFEDEEKMIHIPLDPAKTAMENAQTYFRQSSKRKRSIEILEQEKRSAEADLLYLDSVLAQLRDASLQELPEIRKELENEGFLKKIEIRGKKPAKQSQRPSQPDHYLSNDGWSIWVGRNNQQNDRLSIKSARPHDLWLHVQDGAGSHVLIRREGNQEIPQKTLEEAALLAAYFSKSRDSSNVAVVYTEARHVWKPNGARPGHVLYDHQQTLFVTPRQVDMEALLKRKNQV
ncbi:Rqc2 family fibronectin-binding protein [Alicyclobacillus tolerans]|uniref:Rqc2 homolog RqcH n=1 Tax=Alicyclobacillus tolerans TaxID=90970 RepID=A0A1M6Q7K8_9BACL|nr:NFACT RNA binding domain-containing protein [Alicyclobacillus montanus]SHK16138.1 Predicted component of the ribosome quality control (RQC) complex, YloA/Tae2 family, contains fibronectin-binding (FbpA) and DUF814 domains [Alicyclobacillus montanus]